MTPWRRRAARAAHVISLVAAAVWAVPGVAVVASGEVPADHALEAFVLGLLVAANTGAVVWSWFHERRGGAGLVVTGASLSAWALVSTGRNQVLTAVLSGGPFVLAGLMLVVSGAGAVGRRSRR